MFWSDEGFNLIALHILTLIKPMPIGIWTPDTADTDRDRARLRERQQVLRETRKLTGHGQRHRKRLRQDRNRDRDSDGLRTERRRPGHKHRQPMQIKRHCQKV